MPKLNEEIYGGDPMDAAKAIDTKLDTPKPTLDEHGETDDRAHSEGNHGKN
jgi:hypothetical protein